MHNPTAQSSPWIIRVSDQSGSHFTPLIDAFHPVFPASLQNYIWEPYRQCSEDSKHDQPDDDQNCVDHYPCHIDVNNPSMTKHSAGMKCASKAHDCRRFGRGDELTDAANEPAPPARNLLPVATHPIFKLPSELSDLILSYLSPAALDAARHTCKDWRRRILSSSWILTSVLGVKETSYPLDKLASGSISHRNLLKKLDRDSSLPSTYQHADAWRPRFRTRSLEFSLPSPSSLLTKPAFVAAARLGTQNGFVVFQLRDLSEKTGHRLKSTLVVYRFDLADLPCYAGTIYDVEGQGALRVTSVKEIRRHTEWLLQIEIGQTAGLYLLNTREAFSKFDSRFSLRSLEPSEGPLRLSANETANLESDKIPSSGDQNWKVLARLPPNGGLRHVCCSEDLRKHAKPRFLAEQVETGDIHVVVEMVQSGESSDRARPSLSRCSSGYPKRTHHFTSIAILSRPRPNTVYKNIAIAPTVIKDESIRTAILWQTTSLEKPISELYNYEISEAMYNDPCKPYGSNNPEMVFHIAKNPGDGAEPRLCHLVQGKRVTSLDQQMGGTHPSSPLYHRASPQDIATGGLQFPHTAENQDTYPRNVQYQKLIVWGPAAPTEREPCIKLSFKIFDFSFADPQLFRSLPGHGGQEWQRQDDGSPSDIALKHLHCACALHDDGFRILLPDAAAVFGEPRNRTAVLCNRESTRDGGKPSRCGPHAPTAPVKDLKDSLLPLTASPSWSANLWALWAADNRSISRSSDNSRSVPNTHDDYTGTISPNDSAARAAALERQQEWLRGRIRGMKRAGLSDSAVAQTWGNSAWTSYGQVRKPEGWRDLGAG